MFHSGTLKQQCIGYKQLLLFLRQRFQSCSPPNTFSDVLPAKRGFQRPNIVAELGIEESATIVGVQPGNRMILAHGFAATGFEKITHRVIAGFINSQ